MRADRALSLASANGDRRLTARAQLLRLDIRRADGTYADSDAIVGSERAAVLSDAEASGDPLAMALARQSLAEQAWIERRFTDSQAEIRRATEHARQTGDPRFELESEVEMLVSSLSGPDPAGGDRHARPRAAQSGDRLPDRPGQDPADPGSGRGDARTGRPGARARRRGGGHLS